MTPRRSRALALVVLGVVFVGCSSDGGSAADTSAAAAASDGAAASDTVASVTIGGTEIELPHSTCGDYGVLQAFAVAADGAVSVVVSQATELFSVTYDDGVMPRQATTAEGLVLGRSGGVITASGELAGVDGSRSSVVLSIPCAEQPDNGSGTVVIDGTSHEVAAVECLGRNDGSLAVKAYVEPEGETPWLLRFGRQPSSEGLQDRVVLSGGTRFATAIEHSEIIEGATDDLVAAAGFWTFGTDGAVTVGELELASPDGAATAKISADLSCGMFLLIPTRD